MIGMSVNGVVPRNCDRPMNATGPMKSRPRQNPGTRATSVRSPVLTSTVHSAPRPDSSTHRRLSYQRGECGIDRPRVITRFVVTSMIKPPLRLFARQPSCVLVSPSAVT